MHIVESVLEVGILWQCEILRLLLYVYRVARKSPIDFALLLQGYESSDKLFFFDQNFSMRLKITKKSFLFNFSTIGLHHSLQPLEAFILYCTLTVKLLVELYQ